MQEIWWGIFLAFVGGRFISGVCYPGKYRISNKRTEQGGIPPPTQNPRGDGHPASHNGP